ncbi:protein HIRA homolog [Drosophila bipectinata]|uniref:protein HIRA homolog n=1 Tax=Drosophila bipectinata TaxID=42026 RepID=UPI001C890937|nr:protein HIRA homolog [Drosophila bipectinata]
MRLIKPGWVHHDDKQIFSVDIHQDCTKFATGGQGNDCGLVVIWNLLPLLSEKAEHDASVPKMLCQMDQHLACVNCVRWSHSGLCLASGSDDKLIMIWRKSAGSSGVFGSGGMQKNHESWKCFHTLRGHFGDVLDLAWSPNDLYLASCSVDNTVVIWDARAFPHVVATLRGHTGLVKGVSWDPVGRFLASQSDDRSIRIWRTDGWTMEHKITEPFEECGGTTHILRLSWSPDGQYLVSAHAMNGGGPTAQIIEREGWKFDKDFVGHRKAVTCVRFHNSILRRQVTDGKPLQYCCLAVGSRDRSLSVWLTALQRPMVVIHELFHDSVLDLSWGTKECLLMACSGDGSIACLQFDATELGTPVPDGDKSAIIQKLYGMAYGDGLAAAKASTMEHPERLLKPQSGEQAPILETRPVNFPISTESSQRPISQQTETRTKDGKRRITPMFIPLHEDGPTSLTTSIVSSSVAGSGATASRAVSSTAPTESAATPLMPEPLVRTEHGRLDSRLKPQPSSNQRRQSQPVDPADLPRLPRVEEHQSSTTGPPDLQVTPTGKSEFVKAALDYRVHVQNGYLKTTHGMLAKITASDSTEMLWEFLAGSPVVNLNLCEKYAMLCSLDGSMRLVSMETGCPVFPAISLISSAVHCTFSPDNRFVGVVTNCGMLRVWDIARRSVNLAGEFTQLLSAHGQAIQFSVTDYGLPLIGFANGQAYTYSTSLQSWLVLATKDAIMFHGIKGTLPRDMEGISQKFPVLGMQASSSNYFCFSAGMELRKAEAWQQSAKMVFIENQIKLCETLESLDELKHWHRMLTFQLATYGTEKRMRQFLDDLLEDPEPGIPQFVPKQELMQCVLDTLKPHSQWQLMYAEYVDMFKTSKSQRQEEVFATPKAPQPKDDAPTESASGAEAASAAEKATAEAPPQAAEGSPPAATSTGVTNTTSTTSSSSSLGSSSTSSSSSSSSSAPAVGLSPENPVLDDDSHTVCIEDSSSLPPLLEASTSPPANPAPV